ncbi:TetR/AcrR family transcriptional regulator [Nocardia terpenica]|uniref:TetR family transcriptional regulator n=1 Tax=Nocardia terpenica TaxID=455432 RepID=A0A6G9Z9J5_9NOCA|nr:TetR/AcrR family transcriptional regulator [Nocardia terpenica]QIS22208.1 TetR family transcriptional regulator [Nocardia terpenica]
MARPKKVQPDDAVEAAMQTFWSKGYAATSTADLIDSTGLGRGSLYHAFTSKHHLFEQALERYHARGENGQIRRLDGEGTVPQRIRRLMLEGITRIAEDPERRGCLACNTVVELAGSDPAAVALARRSFTRLENTLTDVLTAGQRAGEIRADRPARVLATAVMSGYYGLLVLAKAAPDPRSLEDTVDTLIAGLC